MSIEDNKHPELIEWERKHKRPLHIGCKVKILETCVHFEPETDEGTIFTIVLMFVDSGGLCMGINDGQSDNYLCEVDGYYITDLEPSIECNKKAGEHE